MESAPSLPGGEGRRFNVSCWRRPRPRRGPGTSCRVTRSEAPTRSRYGVMPPRNIGQPAPRIMQRSMSSGPATTPSSSMRPISSARASCVRRSTSSAVEGESPKDISARVSAGMTGLPACHRGRIPDGFHPVVDQLLQVLRDREPVAEGGVQGFLDVLGDRQSHHGTEGERRHRQAHRAQRVVRHVGRGALVEGGGDFAHQAQQEPVHHERRGVLDQHGGLLEALGELERGGQHGVVGLRAHGRSPAAASRPPG